MAKTLQSMVHDFSFARKTHYEVDLHDTGAKCCHNMFIVEMFAWWVLSKSVRTLSIEVEVPASCQVPCICFSPFMHSILHIVYSTCAYALPQPRPTQTVV